MNRYVEEEGKTVTKIFGFFAMILLIAGFFIENETNAQTSFIVGSIFMIGSMIIDAILEVAFEIIDFKKEVQKFNKECNN